MSERDPGDEPRLLSTGIVGLDEVLRGGLVRDRLYLIEGSPGSGKTTLALQFLLEGVRQGERCLFVSLSETRDELEATAVSHGWSLAGIDLIEIVPSEETLDADARYTMYHPSEVELAETTRTMLTEVERLKPVRLVIDSLSELRLLAESPLRYRRQILALKQHFAARSCTVLFIDDRSGADADAHLHSLAHGVISLEREPVEYGTTRRRVFVGKMRGRAFREGYHDFALMRGGLAVFPRLVASEHRAQTSSETVPSDLPVLDEMLGGGLSRGTSTLVMGPAGSGKSWLAGQYVAAAATRGERSALYLFDESLATFELRARSLGIGSDNPAAALSVVARQIDPAEMAPGEFAHVVRQAVERDGVRLLVIDSLSGFMNAMPSTRFLMLHLHELLTYLGQKGVTTLLLLAQHGGMGVEPESPVDASYLADTVLQLRYVPSGDEVRKTISVVKKRTGPHSTVAHELRFGDGLSVGPPVPGRALKPA